MHFPDPILETTVRDAIYKPTGDIYSGELAVLTSLTAYYAEIMDLTGLEYAVNLSNLYLDGNQIRDLSPLANLTKLQHLTLGHNEISDISALANLTNLEWLLLYDNQISNISPLANLTNLEYLWLWNNHLTDIGPLVTNSQNGGLGEGDHINLKYNDLDIETGSQAMMDIQVLLNEGASVDYSPQRGSVVHFPDPFLETTVRDAIYKPTGDIYSGDLAALTSFKAYKAEITDLTGLEYAVNLSKLSLMGNRIRDISPLASLTKLQDLDLNSNEIGDISALSNLKNLSSLDLNYNQISDISVLGNLPNLQYLWLNNNRISDISALSGFNNLNVVGLVDNQITDIFPLAGMTSLQSIYLAKNQVSDLSSLTNLTNLQFLSLDSNKISNISALTGSTNLKYLGLWNNYLTDIGPLVTNSQNGGIGEGDYINLDFNDLDVKPGYQAMLDIQVLLDNGASVTYSIQRGPVVHIPDPFMETTVRDAIYKPTGEIYSGDLASLEFFNGYDAKITDLTGLEHAVNLSGLYLTGNQIRDLSPLANLTGLQYLRLGGNEISDISPLANFTKLISLDLNYNQISDISVLGNLTNLEQLSIQNNMVQDIHPLAGLTKLEGLWLGENLISDISALTGLTNLTFLALTNNEITNISALENMTKLQSLWLYENQISDISALANLTNLNYLMISNNQVSDISVLGNLTSLKKLLVGQNNISDITPLAGLIQLRQLALYSNQITDISALKDITTLQNLFLSGNQIIDVSALANLTNLRSLFLDGNHLTDISPLAANSQNGGLGEGDYINLQQNHLDIASGARAMADIQVLLDNGARVDYSSQTGTISGTITDAAGNPLGGVSLDVGGWFTYTNEDGTYIIELPFGTYNVSSPSRYRSGTNDGDWAWEKYPSEITIDAAHPNVTGVDFSLEPGGSISGRITDEAGVGVPYAKVWVDINTGSDIWHTVSRIKADASGYYVLRGLPSGQYKVGADTEAKLTTFYSGAQNRNDAQTIVVTAPNNITDINLSLPPGGNIFGRITDAAGSPLSGISVEAGGRWVTTDVKGYYAIELPFGTYEVFSPSQNRAGTNDGDWAWEKYISQITISPAKPSVFEVDFILEPGGSISGRITDSSGAGVPNAQVWAEKKLESAHWAANSKTTTDQNGNYILKGLGSGEYKVGAETEDLTKLYYSGTMNWNNAQSLMVTAPEKISNINISVSLIEGDFNNDTVINYTDLKILADDYGLAENDDGFDSKFDLNDDGVINLFDLVIQARKL